MSRERIDGPVDILSITGHMWPKWAEVLDEIHHYDEYGYKARWALVDFLSLLDKLGLGEQ
jgi:hypothetical protein